jgi:site-specific recombinase XerD
MREKLEQYKQYLINIHRSLVYYNFLNPFFKYLEKEQLEFSTLTKDQLAYYFKYTKYSPNAINNLIKACRNFCQYANIDNHPCFEIPLVKVVRKIIEYMTLEDIEKSIKYVATYSKRFNSDKVACLLYFMFYTGVRKSEIVNLKRAKFDLENCTVLIYEEKTKQEKIIPYPFSINDKLKAYFKSEPEELNAFNIKSKQIDYLFHNVISKYLGKKVKPHLTRHGCARYLQEQGIPPTVVQKILGHQNLATTLIYMTPDQRMIEESYRKKIK